MKRVYTCFFSSPHCGFFFLLHPGIRVERVIHALYWEGCTGCSWKNLDMEKTKKSQKVTSPQGNSQH